MMLIFNPSPVRGRYGRWLNLKLPHLRWLLHFSSSLALFWVLSWNHLNYDEILLASLPSMSWLRCISPFWTWLSQLSNNRCILNILGFSWACFLLWSAFRPLSVLLTVKFYRALVCSDASHSLDPSRFPLRPRRNKLQYLVHFLDLVKVL